MAEENIDSISEIQNRLQNLLEEKELARRMTFGLKQDLEQADIQIEGLRVRDSE